MIRSDEREIKDISGQIAAASRKNFILERELSEIDDKIKLLIKNRITVQEIFTSSKTLTETKSAAGSDGKHSGAGGDDSLSLRDKKPLYEEMFYLLQTKPKYFATLARIIPAKDIPTFVQTVVFDMYGDQYDTREERLLLSLFRAVLQRELEDATGKGSLLRANTAITQMLSAYARRGQGLSILKEILEDPLKKMINDKKMNLEINPQKVYQQMISDYETTSGKKHELPAAVDDDTAAKNTNVQAIIKQRCTQLLAMADLIFNRIVGAAENVPVS